MLALFPPWGSFVLWLIGFLLPPDIGSRPVGPTWELAWTLWFHGPHPWEIFGSLSLVGLVWAPLANKQFGVPGLWAVRDSGPPCWGPSCLLWVLRGCCSVAGSGFLGALCALLYTVRSCDNVYIYIYPTRSKAADPPPRQEQNACDLAAK